MSALEKYLALVRSLLEARATAGDHLSDAEEDRRAQELEDLWWSMTEKEQAACEEPTEAMKREYP